MTSGAIHEPRARLSRALAGLLAALLAVSSCSVLEPAPEPTPPRSAVDVNLNAPVALTFWHAFTSDPQRAALDDLVTEFNRTNGRGITVRALGQGGYTPLYEKTLDAIRTSTTPELAQAYESFLADYMKADAVIDLVPYVKSARNGLTQAQRDDVFPAYYEANTFAQFGGKLLAFPFTRSLLVRYQNDDLLQAARIDSPRTWAEFERAVMALTQKDASGKTTRYGLALPLDPSTFHAWVVSMGGALVAADGRTIGWNGGEGLAALQMADRLLRGGYAYVPRAVEHQTDFALGRLPFFMGPTSLRPAIGAAVRSPVRWSIQPVPQTGTARPLTVQFGSNIAVMRSTPEKQLASWLFVKWLSDRDQTARWARLTSSMPVRRSAADTQALKDWWASADPQGKQAFDLIESSIPEPNLRGEQDIRDVVLDALVKISTRAATPEDALKVAADRANAILRESQ